VLSIKDFPEDLHRDMKMAALQRGVHLRELVIEAFEKLLERERNEAEAAG
jgi:hypothetical protein